jgi:hypothetical protein
MLLTSIRGKLSTCPRAPHKIRDVRSSKLADVGLCATRFHIKSPIVLLTALLFLSFACHSEELKTLSTSGVSISIPSSWKAVAVAEPILHTVTNVERSKSVSVVRERKSESGVTDLKEYFDFKLERLRTTWEAAREGSPQKAQIGGKAALLVEVSATLTDPKGRKIQTQVYLATVEGAEYYYLVIAMVRSSEAKGSSSEVNGIIHSLNAP